MARTASRFLAAATASLGIAGLVLTTACYTYNVRAPGDLASGQHVEVTVNNLGRVVLAPDLGEDIAKVEGDVVSVNDSTLRMAVTHVEFVNGTGSVFPGSEIGVPRKTITSVSTKEFSRSKTAVVAVGLAAALIAAIGAFGLGGIGGSSPEPKDGGNTGTQ